jgi:hypothetical protein
MSKGIFSQRGAWVYYNGESFSQGRDNAIEKIKSDPELVSTLEGLIKDGVQADPLS